MRPQPSPVGPDQESVWDYPRPPRLASTGKWLRVIFNGELIAETDRGFRVLETSHPPVYYFPPQDVQTNCLRPGQRQSNCEWKGEAVYFDTIVKGQTAGEAAWSYPNPEAEYEAISNYFAFYAAAMDACYVEDELVTPQPGQPYGGWINRAVVGPFKGEPGSETW